MVLNVLQGVLKNRMDDIYFSKQGRKSESNQKPAPTRGKKRSFSKALFLLLLVIVMVVTGAFGYVYNMMRKTNYNPAGHKENVYVTNSELTGDSKVVNILFIGIDRRPEVASARSDSMILFTVDKINKKIKLTSFLRDIWLYIPGNDSAKLNASCNYGGAQLVMDTIEYNFGIRIDKYVLLDFDTFEGIVDKLGGIETEVTEKEAKYLRDEVHLNVQAGSREHLNGMEALWYCRIRFLDSDFMRTYRQRKVIASIIETAGEKSVFDLADIVEATIPGIETDLNPLDLTKLAFGTFFSYMRYDVEQMRVPVEGTWKDAVIKGQIVLETDIGANRDSLRNFLYAKDIKDTGETEQSN